MKYLCESSECVSSRQKKNTPNNGIVPQLFWHWVQSFNFPIKETPVKSKKALYGKKAQLYRFLPSGNGWLEEPALQAGIQIDKKKNEVFCISNSKRCLRITKGAFYHKRPYWRRGPRSKLTIIEEESELGCWDEEKRWERAFRGEDLLNFVFPRGDRRGDIAHVTSLWSQPLWEEKWANPGAARGVRRHKSTAVNSGYELWMLKMVDDRSAQFFIKVNFISSYFFH